MATKIRDTQITFSAPISPIPPEEYNQGWEIQKNGMLRLYFHGVDVALRNALQFDTDDIIDGTIPNSKLENSTVSFGGITLALGASDATPAFNLTDATGYPTSSLVGTITNAQLAGSIANAKLVNDSVSYGGISLDLGGSDATPAFDLSDATNYPTSSLVGTITNAQLAGSIANAKLVNDSVNFGGITVALGASDTTPAFNLADATGYPTSSLSGTITNAQLAGSIAGSKLADTYLEDVVDDTSPQLGGDLDLNSSDITGTGDISFTGTLTTDRLMVDHGSTTSSIMTSTTQASPQILFRAGFSGTQYSHFQQLSFQDSAGNVKGSVSNNSFSTSFTTTSDYRLKEDIQAVPNATTRTLALKPCNFQWVGSTQRMDGFLAHELAEQVPEAVTGTKDAVDSDGNPSYQGIDQAKVVPLLVRTIQELEARIAALEDS